ncbi:MAG: serine/threonine-protein kinase, partial [Myxococcota bacterium]
MGEVYAAQDERLGRQVALKLLTRLEDEKHALAEARATARFSHPHIVTLHEVGSHEGRLYLALELLEGHTLQARLREGRLALPEALRIARDVALAVEEAHAHEVHHRDLKPANVFLATDGRLRVLDFGLAELASEARDVRGEGLRGTPAYMAPEQWQKAPSTAAADVWALGIMLHEALAGAHPCPRRDPAALRRWSSDPSLRSLEELPEAVEALIEACLRPEPSQRPRATELVAQLSGLLASSPFESALPSPFKGLLAFTEADAGRFRGREKEVTTFVERLRNTPTLAILGPSGAGKSSFVRAGVIPRLREFGPLRVIEVRPGRRPLASLAEALDRAETTTVRSMTASLDSVEASSSAASLSRGPLPDPPAEDDLVPGRVASRLRELAERVEGRILVLVDQLEELVVLAESAEERRAFMATLAAAADDANTPVRVVYTLREEFSSRIVNAAESSAALSQVVVLRDPSPSELRRVLFEPVAAAGYAFDDPTVVDAMIEEVRGRQASLPLLQFAGARLWEARDREGQRLLRAEYDAMGGVAGALAHQADEILSTLGPDEMVMGRSLWLRLVTPERTRRSLPRDDLVAGLGEVGEALLGQFMEARLIVT